MASDWRESATTHRGLSEMAEQKRKRQRTPSGVISAHDPRVVPNETAQ